MAWKFGFLCSAVVMNGELINSSNTSLYLIAHIYSLIYPQFVEAESSFPLSQKPITVPESRLVFLSRTSYIFIFCLA